MERLSVRVLGLEGFIVNDVTVYAALSRIADFSSDTPAPRLSEPVNCSLAGGQRRQRRATSWTPRAPGAT